jgi:hypothetical protein
LTLAQDAISFRKKNLLQLVIEKKVSLVVDCLEQNRMLLMDDKIIFKLKEISKVDNILRFFVKGNFYHY